MFCGNSFDKSIHPWRPASTGRTGHNLPDQKWLLWKHVKTCSSCVFFTNFTCFALHVACYVYLFLIKIRHEDTDGARRQSPLGSLGPFVSLGSLGSLGTVVLFALVWVLVASCGIVAQTSGTGGADFPSFFKHGTNFHLVYRNHKGVVCCE